MKKICTSLILTLGVWHTSFSQTKQEQLQGIWENIMSESSGEMLIRIVNGISVLSIAHQGEEYINFYLAETIESFINVEDFETININDFDANGEYYISVFRDDIKRNQIQKKNYMMRNKLYFDDDRLIIEGGKFAEYVHLDRLPPLTMHLLYRRGRKDNRDYLKEYLNINVMQIATSQVTICSYPNIPTRMYLIKGDMVIVLEEREGWLRVEYEGKKVVTGWIKKEDVEGE